jgi:hypothetical protein
VIAGVLLGILKAGKGLPDGWDLNDHPVVVLVVLATAAIGLWKIQSKTNANSEMAKQFAHMCQVFDEASRLIRASLGRGDLTTARDVMREVGKEALAEHGEWLLLHRQRPIELPKA